LYEKTDGFPRESGKMVGRVIFVLVLVVVVFSLIGCRTVQGLREDIKWIGEKGSEIVDQ
jgi:predicted small secreted protein